MDSRQSLVSAVFTDSDDGASIASSNTTDEDAKAFPFLALPPEIRLRIYALLLRMPHTIDLEPSNYKALAPLRALLLTSRQLHDEAAPVFYGGNTFRVFPTSGRFFRTKWPLVSRLPARHRRALRALEIRLGPGWTKPPKTWDGANPRLKLAQHTGGVRTLKVFLECDPSSDVFRGFRVSDGFYTGFCVRLFAACVERLEGLVAVEFDGYPAVRRAKSPILRELGEAAEARGLRVVWAPNLLEPLRRGELAAAIHNEIVNSPLLLSMS